MLDFEQQANQAQALASLDEDWHLLEDAKMRLEEDLVIRRRPTMISAKYRAREERRRLLKVSACKLRAIEDPETCLYRSVLINNIMRRLNREGRDEKTTRSYGFPVVSYLNDSTKENNVSSNLIVGMTDDDTSSRKRLSDDSRNDGINAKRQRHDDLDLQDDVFSDFYMLPPTPRLLPHIDEMQESESPHHHHLVFPEDRLGSLDVRSSTTMISTNTANTTTTSTSTSANSCCNSIFPGELDDPSSQLANVTRLNDVSMMDTSDVVDPDRICDFTRFADSAKTLEERLVELQSLDEHFDLSKFERNNNQTCGRAFHDIQTFHSLVPGLET